MGFVSFLALFIVTASCSDLWRNVYTYASNSNCTGSLVSFDGSSPKAQNSPCKPSPCDGFEEVLCEPSFPGPQNGIITYYEYLNDDNCLGEPFSVTGNPNQEGYCDHAMGQSGKEYCAPNGTFTQTTYSCPDCSCAPSNVVQYESGSCHSGQIVFCNGDLDAAPQRDPQLRLKVRK